MAITYRESSIYFFFCKVLVAEKLSPMTYDGDLHVMSSSRQFLKCPWFNSLKNINQVQVHALDAHLHC
ncbi:hypothetical protein KSS87_012308 [Heliosperma pusillum]|nr:hypothetical protein KSS87_012308 [Heliosperma pusillum]